MEMSQYLDMFIEESREHIQAINQNLLELEKDSSNKNTINEIFRSAHTSRIVAMSFCEPRSCRLQLSS